MNMAEWSPFLFGSWKATQIGLKGSSELETLYRIYPLGKEILQSGMFYILSFKLQIDSVIIMEAIQFPFTIVKALIT